jgi:hypothetical protein
MGERLLDQWIAVDEGAIAVKDKPPGMPIEGSKKRL